MYRAGEMSGVQNGCQVYGLNIASPVVEHANGQLYVLVKASLLHIIPLVELINSIDFC